MVTTRRSLVPRDDDSTTIFAFVTLSMLLHLLVVLLFGTAPGTGASRGDTLWGRLEVTLRRLSSDDGSGFRLAPGADTSTSGPSIFSPPERSPAAVPPAPRPAERREPPAPPPIDPQATPMERTIEPTPPVQEAPAIMPELAPRLPAPTFDALPRLNLQAPELVDKPLAPPTLPQPAPPPAPSVIAPSTTAPREMLPTPPSLQPVAPAPAPVETPAPQKSTPETQEAPSAIEPLPRAMPTPIERIAPPQMDTLRTPAIESPREVPTPATVPVQPIAPARVEPDIAPALPPSPRSVPADVVAPPERIAPAREPLPAAEPISRSAPVDTVPRTDRIAPSPGVPERGTATPASPRSQTPGGEAATQRRPGTPDGDDDIFKPRRETITPSEPGAAPRIDLEATKKRARELVSEDYRGVIPAVPPPPVGKNKLGEAIAKAAKPDCRTAYADMGLLAVVPLAAATIGDGKCRW